MQLDACLRSLKDNCKDIEQCRARVIYASSNERSLRQYETLRRSHNEVEFIRQTSFHSNLIQAIEGFSHVLFSVDDNLFVGKWSVSEVIDALDQNERSIGFSFRLGANTSFSYSINKTQELPEFLPILPHMQKYRWTTAVHDFGYPLEVSSSMYRVEPILSLIKSASTITHPNSLEAFLDGSKDQFRGTHPDLLCFTTSVAFCNPLNIVQVDWMNRCRDDFDNTIYALMRKFDLGYRIDIRPLQNFITNACHQEVDISFLVPPTESATLLATIDIRSSRTEPGAGSEGLKMDESIAASSSLSLSDLNGKDRDRMSELLSFLRTRRPETDWLLGMFRMLDDRADDQMIHFQSMLISLKQQLVEVKRLKEEWYEPELYRLNSETNSEIIRLNRVVTEYETNLSHLRAEMGRIEHRFVRKVRIVLKNRWPRLFYFIRSLVQRGLAVWGRQQRLSEALSAISNTRAVSNSQWPIQQPLLSVVIASFNYGKYLHETIDSVLSQTFQDFEIIVIDDGSTDPYTRDVLAALDKPKTRVVIQGNQGLPKTRNNGIKLARGKYICCLDSDDCLKSTYLEKCVYHLETRSLDVCFSWVQTFGESSSIWETGPFSIDVLMNGNSVCVSAVFKKALWVQVGGFKEVMTHGYDDWEFWLSLSEQGAIGHCIPEPLMLHRKHPASMSAGMKHRYDAIAQDIKSLHCELFNKPSRVKTIRQRQKRRFKVSTPLCNLLRPRNHDAPPRQSGIRVLLTTPWFDLSGASIAKKDIFTRLAENGISVTAIATNMSSDSFTENGLPLYETITDDCFDLPRFLGDHNKVDFVKYLIQSRGLQLLYLAGSREMYEMLPDLKKTFPGLRVMDELYNVVGHIDSNREFHKFIDFNVVVNEEIRERLIGLGESEERIQVITPGIDADYFCPDNPVCREAVLQRPHRRFTFGFLGRLSPEKRPFDFVRLANQFPSCQFRMAGDGPLMSRLSEEIASQNISDRCHLEGFTKNAVGFLSEIDVLVIPSEIEGLPLVLLEAMALELPVIATSVGGIPRVVMHGKNGFLYKPCQIDELIALATTLSQMPADDRKCIGRSARETVLRGHTISACAASYLTTFRKLANTRSNSHNGMGA